MTTSVPEQDPLQPLEVETWLATRHLLISFMREQESDRRMLSLVQKHAETTTQRHQRIVVELRSSNPAIAPSVIETLVKDTTQTYEACLSKHEDLADISTAIQVLVDKYVSELPPSVDSVLLVQQLLRACLDTPDSHRMIGRLLVSAIATLEGFLLSLLRITVSCARGSDRRNDQGYRALSVQVVLPHSPSDVEEMEGAERKVRGGWNQWVKYMSGEFGVELPERPLAVEDAFEVRNAIVHRQGSLNRPIYVHLPGSQQAILLHHADEISPAILDWFIDSQLIFAAQVTTSVLRMLPNSSPQRNAKAISPIQYEALLRRRNQAAADLLPLFDTLKPGSDSYRVAQVNAWLGLHRLGRVGAYRRELDRWEPSSEFTVFGVARAVLMNHPVKARKLAHLLYDAGHIEERSWLTWPLFDGLR